MDKKVYEHFLNYGTIIEVGKDKKPLKNWKGQTKSDPFKDGKNYGIIPNNKLCIIDVDTKHGGVGAETFTYLQDYMMIEDLKPTVITPSGGYHYYIENDNNLNFPKGMRRTFKDLKDIEFITGSTSGYVLLPTNKGIQTVDSTGKAVTGEYEYVGDIYDDKDINFSMLFNNIYLREEHPNIAEKRERPKSRRLKRALDKKEVKRHTREPKKRGRKKKVKTVNVEEVESCLQWLDSDDYSEWVTIGGHIKKAFKNNPDGEGYDVFEAWSLNASEPATESNIKKKWKNLPSDDGEGLPSLIYLAKDAKIHLLKNSKDKQYKIDLIQEFPKLLVGETKKQVENIIKKDEDLKELFFPTKDEDIGKIVNAKKIVHIQNHIIFPTIKATYSSVILDRLKVGGEMVQNSVTAKEQMQDIDLVMRNMKIVNGKLSFLNYENGMVTAFGDQRDINGISWIIGEAMKPDFHLHNGQIAFNLKAVIKSIMLVADNHTMVEMESITQEGFILDEKKKHITKYIKREPKNIDYGDDSNISEAEEYKIINAYNKHFYGYDMILLKWAIAGKYQSNMKNTNIAFLANSDYGKGFHFGMLVHMKIGAYNKIKDFCKNGESINKRPMREYANKHVHLFNETAYMPRNYFDIEDKLIFNASYKQPVELDLGTRVFLDADGGLFNSDMIEEQIINRINIMDFRVSKRKINTLYGFDKYTKDIYYSIIYNYYKKHLIDYINFLENSTNIIQSKEYLYLDKQLRNLVLLDENLNDLKISIDKYNFFEALEDTIKTSLQNLDSFTKEGQDILLNQCHYHKSTNSLVIQNASKYLPLLFSGVNSDLTREFEYKKMKTISTNIDLVKASKTFKFNGKPLTAFSIDLNDIDIDEQIIRLVS